jgi:hypothetical protein
MENRLEINSDLVRERIRHVVLLETGLSEDVANNVAFHMTDWLKDLEAFHSFCVSPQSMPDEVVSSLLIRFLIHVPNHLAAASKLYMDIPVTDVFNVGSTSESD